MSAAAISPSSPSAVVEQPAWEADLDYIAKNYHTIIGDITLPYNKDAPTVCHCCGSQRMNAKGEVMIVNKWVGQKPATNEILKRQWGDKVEERFPKDTLAFLRSAKTRVGAPGITIAEGISKDEVIKILYPEEGDRPLAGGIDLEDKDNGPVAVVWIAR
jgi:hypothetical protein